MFNQVNTPDKNLQLIQTNIDAALTPLQASPLAGGVLLANISLVSAQDNLISHNLGHVPQRWFSFVPNVSCTIWSPTSSSLNGASADSTRVNLRTSTTCVVTIWII